MFGSKGGRAERKKQFYYTSTHFNFVPTIFDGREYWRTKTNPENNYV